MMERPSAGQWLLAVGFQPPPGARGVDWEGLGTKPWIPSSASLTLDLVMVAPNLKRKGT